MLPAILFISLMTPGLLFVGWVVVQALRGKADDPPQGSKGDPGGDDAGSDS